MKARGRTGYGLPVPSWVPPRWVRPGLAIAVLGGGLIAGVRHLPGHLEVRSRIRADAAALLQTRAEARRSSLTGLDIAKLTPDKVAETLPAGWQSWGSTPVEALARAQLMADISPALLRRFARLEPVALEELTPRQRELLKLIVRCALERERHRFMLEGELEIFGPVRYCGDAGFQVRARLSTWPRPRLRDKVPIWVRLGNDF